MTRIRTASPRKAAANRRNALKSTGPRTAQGKRWSRLNALKHGILASQAVIVALEGRADRKLFDQTVEGLAQDFQPVGTYEQLLVQEIAACFWRKRRLLRFENRAAFDAVELPASEIVNHPYDKPIPWKDPLYTQGNQLTTAESIYKHSGLDAITLPNQADTMRVIRYEAAINRTRERAVASLREMRKVRGNAVRRPAVPVVDREAARRNAATEQAKMLPPFFSKRVWLNLAEQYEEASVASEAELARMERALKAENYQTKPKTPTGDELNRRVREALAEGFGLAQHSEDFDDEPETPPSD